MKTFAELFTDARSISTPLVAVRTFDPLSTIATVKESLGSETSNTPTLAWDAILGLNGMNDKGKDVLADMLSESGTDRAATVDHTAKHCASQPDSNRESYETDEISTDNVGQEQGHRGGRMNWFIIWSPEGRAIAKVEAEDAVAAKRMTPAPYRKYLGEVYVIEDVCTCKNNEDYCDRCLAAGRN